MQGTFCTADFPFSGWAAGLDPERRLFLAFWTGRKWDFCCVDFLFSGIWLLWSRSGWKSEMPWEARKSMPEPFFWQSASFFFCWLAEFLCGEFSYQSIGKKWEKDYSMLIYVLHYAVLQALSRCFKGRRSLLAKGYHQYGMMFVFAVTVVMVAVYANARACLKNHSRKL